MIQRGENKHSQYKIRLIRRTFFSSRINSHSISIVSWTDDSKGTQTSVCHKTRYVNYFRTAVDWKVEITLKTTNENVFPCFENISTSDPRTWWKWTFADTKFVPPGLFSPPWINFHLIQDLPDDVGRCLVYYETRGIWDTLGYRRHVCVYVRSGRRPADSSKAGV